MRVNLACTLIVAVSSVGCGSTPWADEPRCGTEWSVADVDGVCRERTWRALGAGWGQNAYGLEVAVSKAAAHAAWIETHGAESDVVALTTADEPQDPLTLTASLEGRVDGLALAVSAEDLAVAAWRSITPDSAQVYWSERRPAGAWSTAGGENGRLSYGRGGYEPFVAHGDSGELLIAWNQERATGLGVAVARRSPAGQLSMPTGDDELLSPPVNFSNEPRVAVGRDGYAVVVWYQSPGGSLRAYLSERLQADASFPHVVDPVSDPGGPVESPVPAVRASDEATLVWPQVVDGGWAIFLTDRSNHGWSPPERLAGPYPLARRVSAMRTARGATVIVWEATDEHGVPGLYLAHRRADREWEVPGHSPRKLTSGRAFGSTMVAAGDDSVAIAYLEQIDEDRHVRVHLDPHRAGRVTTLARGPETSLASVALAARDSSAGPARLVAGWIDDGSVWLSELEQ